MEIRIAIYHQALLQETTDCLIFKYTERQNFLKIISICHQTETEAIALLQNDTLLNKNTFVPVQISTTKVRILGKDVPTSDLIRFNIPNIVSQFSNWLFTIEMDCAIAHPPPILRTSPPHNPHFPNYLSERMLHRRLEQMEYKCHAWLCKGLEWVIRQLQVKYIKLPHVSVRLLCPCLHYGLRPISCSWIFPHATEHSRDMCALELDLPASSGQPAYDLCRLLGEAGDDIQYPGRLQREWQGLLVAAQPYFAQSPELRRRLYAAWKWLGIDKEKFETGLQEAYDCISQVGRLVEA
ncbi:MAG: hypothetical protein LQ338_007721 [Usnochroma carphineum]|nr:MAG: hypothetical protein LQ338_007721 [Usnochroma carphineum]